MKLALYPHGGCGNHGCEAIVKSTYKITKGDITLLSSAPKEDIQFGLDKICKVLLDHREISKRSFSYFLALWRKKINHDVTAFDRLYFEPVFQAAKSADYILSIGGDNYCYGVPSFIYLVNKELRKQGKKTILWGCSVEPDSIKGDMLEDLSGYHSIVARESITYKAMLAKGLRQAVLVPDPAFQLNRIDLPLPNGFIEGNTVGINISPMIINCECKKGIALQNYITLIEYIIKQTDMQIALIPHVVWTHNDDRIPLRLLYERFQETGRVCMIEDHNAEELKGYIARCRFMIVARTHASIAAYSQCVPTLVVGYSVKARGIATDIFGKDDKFVLPVQSLQSEEDLKVAFIDLVKNEQVIKNRLREKMPSYIESVFQLSSIL